MCHLLALLWLLTAMPTASLTALFSTFTEKVFNDAFDVLHCPRQYMLSWSRCQERKSIKEEESEKDNFILHFSNYTCSTSDNNHHLARGDTPVKPPDTLYCVGVQSNSGFSFPPLQLLVWSIDMIAAQTVYTTCQLILRLLHCSVDHFNILWS